MELVVLLLFGGLDIISIIIAYPVANFLFQKTRDRFKRWATQFLAAFFIFAIAEILIKVGVSLLLNQLIAPNPAYGVIALAVGSIPFLVGNLLVFIVAVIFAFKKTQQPVSSLPNQAVLSPDHPKTSKQKIFVGVAIVSVLLTIVWMGYGQNALYEMRRDAAIASGDLEKLAEIYKRNGEKDTVYRQLAEETKDVSWCDKLSTKLGQTRCYEKTDLEFSLESLGTCPMGVDLGLDTSIPSTNQRACIEKKYIIGNLKNDIPIDCQQLSVDFSQNIFIDTIVQRCNQFVQLQNIKMSGNIERCKEFTHGPNIDYSDFDSRFYATCVGQFVNSELHDEVCSTIESQSSNYYPMTLARCDGYEGFVGSFGTLDAFIQRQFIK